jgi:choline dehydrogenase
MIILSLLQRSSRPITMAPSRRVISWFAVQALLVPNILALSASNVFDYVVVGGGNAGLTVASRLTENPAVRVAVIEAGDFYEIVTGNQSQIPANDVLYNGKAANDTNPLVDWGFLTTPQAVCGNFFLLPVPNRSQF